MPANRNVSSAQFSAPTPRWDADGGVLAMPDHLKRDLDDAPMPRRGNADDVVVLAMPDHLKRDLDDLNNR